jgi:hypothetical protein
MIGIWMLYCVALGVCVAGAALLAEQLAHRHGLATRRVWGVGMVSALALPELAMLVKERAPVVEAGGAAMTQSVTDLMILEGVSTFAALDGTLVTLWGAASVSLALLLGGCAVLTWRRGLAWRPAEVDGVPVLLSRNVGPAVVGFLRTRIVLPAWAVEADTRERAMMLRHEQEHVAAGDPRLVLFASLLVVLMPWNPALWYMAHRMRLAVEVDCDRRVTGGGDLDVRAYGMLLLSVGRRRSLPAYAVGFSRPRSLLEHRIDRMTLPAVRGRGVRSSILALAVAAVLVGAWSIPQPVRAADVDASFEPCPDDAPAMAHPGAAARAE